MEDTLKWAGVILFLPLVIVFAKKYMPGFFGGMLSKVLGKGMSEVEAITDPVEKELVKNIALDVVKWVEYKVPDRGQGAKKFKLAADKLCAMIPLLKGREKDIFNIIQESVAAMDNELRKTAFQLPDES